MFHTQPCHERDDEHKSLYRAIADNLPSGAVFVVDKDLRYRLAAGPTLKDAGFTPSDFEGKLLWEALPAEHVAQHEADYRLMLQGKTIEREHEVNGQYYLSRGTPLKDANGEPQLALAVSYNITERRRFEQRLRLLDAAGEAIHSAGSAGALMAEIAMLLGSHLRADACVFADFDADSAQLVFQHGWAANEGVTLSGTYLLAQFGSPIAEQLRGGNGIAIRNVQQEFKDLTGLEPYTTNNIQAAVFYPLSTKGHLVGMLAVLQHTPRNWALDEISLAEDMAERCWTGIERERMTEMLRKVDQQKERFLATLAHELQNPLAAVETGLMLLKATSSDERSIGRLAPIERQIAQMKHLVNDLFDTSRINQGKIELRRERIAINKVIDNAIETSRPLIDARRHSINVEAPDTQLHINVDPVRVTQVLSNILGNAVRYSAPGSVVHIKVNRDNRDVVIKVSDTGVGISKEMLPKIFEMFAQGDHEHDLGRSGLGIGLSLTKRLVEAHGGTITAESPGPGRGSTFTVTLPSDESNGNPPGIEGIQK